MRAHAYISNRLVLGAAQYVASIYLKTIERNVVRMVGTLDSKFVPKLLVVFDAIAHAWSSEGASKVTVYEAW
jgi:hypothetical protein